MICMFCSDHTDQTDHLSRRCGPLPRLVTLYKHPSWSAYVLVTLPSWFAYVLVIYCSICCFRISSFVDVKIIEFFFKINFNKSACFSICIFIFNFLFNIFDEFSIKKFSIESIFNSNQCFISFYDLIQISLFSMLI